MTAEYFPILAASAAVTDTAVISVFVGVNVAIYGHKTGAGRKETDHGQLMRGWFDIIYLFCRFLEQITVIELSVLLCFSQCIDFARIMA